MKTTKLLIAIILLNVSIAAKLNAKTSINVKHILFHITALSLNADDPNLVLSITKSRSGASLQISFNGNEGVTGTLGILNSSNELIKEFPINLKHSPDFASVNLSEWETGTYTCQLKTSSGVHVSHFTIN